MSELVEFTSANSWEEIFVSPDDVSVIERFRKDRNLGEYSQILMRDGTRIYVHGLPTKVAKKIRDSKASAKEVT